MANQGKRPEPPQGSHGPRKGGNGPRKNGKNGKNGDDRFEVRRAARTLIFWVMMILVVITISTYLSPREEEAGKLTYSEYVELLDQGKVSEGVVENREFTGTLSEPREDGSETFVTVLPFVNEEMVTEWEEKGIKIEFREEAMNWMMMLLTSILPWVILIGIWIFFMRRMSGGANRGIFSFGKSRAKLLTENKPKVTFDDVAGGDEAKEELQEIIQFLKDPKKFQKLGGRIPKGALLVGPPGTGKTLFARAVAGEAEVPFFSMSGADFVEMFVGVGASRVRDLFEQGKQSAPCIIFIDEIDAVGRQRGAGMGGGHDEREQTLNQLLVEMDGFESNEGVILIAATNRPDVLDPALLRPGRFDRQIVVDRPDVRGRKGILKVHTRKIPLSSDVDLNTLAKGTPGLAGADLANLVNEAALLAARRNKEKVGMLDFEDAKDKVMMGTERRSMLISDEEKKLTAYHEAGHVLVAKYTPGSDPVHKVTIIPRGRALGVTHYLPIDEKHSWAKRYIENKMIHLMGGRAAERIIFDDYTNGAASDIKQITAVARRMVTEWGMSEKIGPLDLGNSDHEIFLGRDFGQQSTYSDATALEIDREVKRFVMTAQNRAVDILTEHLDQLHALATALLEHEILDGEEIDLVLAGKELPPPEKHPRNNNGDGKKKAGEAAEKSAGGSEASSGEGRSGGRRRSSRRSGRGRMDEGRIETGGKAEDSRRSSSSKGSGSGKDAGRGSSETSSRSGGKDSSPGSGRSGDKGRSPGSGRRSVAPPPPPLPKRPIPPPAPEEKRLSSEEDEASGSSGESRSGARPSRSSEGEGSSRGRRGEAQGGEGRGRSESASPRRSGDEGVARADERAADADEPRPPADRPEVSERTAPKRRDADEGGSSPAKPEIDTTTGITRASDTPKQDHPRGEPVGRKAGGRRRDRARRSDEDRIREAEEALRKLEGGDDGKNDD